MTSCGTAIAGSPSRTAVSSARRRTVSCLRSAPRRARCCGAGGLPLREGRELHDGAGHLRRPRADWACRQRAHGPGLGRRVPPCGRRARVAVQHGAPARRAGVRDVAGPEADPDGRRSRVDVLRARRGDRRPARAGHQPIAGSPRAPAARRQPLHELHRRARRAYGEAAVAPIAGAERLARLGSHPHDAALHGVGERVPRAGWSPRPARTDCCAPSIATRTRSCTRRS